MTVLDLGQPVPDRGDQRHQVRPRRPAPGRPGVVDGVVDLVAAEPPVDDRVGRAQRGRGEAQLDAGRVVLVEEGDDVAAADPERLQAAGDATDPLVPLRPRPRPAEVAHRLPVGLGCGPVGQAVVDVRRCGKAHA